MKTKSKIFINAALALVALFLASGYSSPVEAARCTAFPKIPLWSTLNHDYVRLKVETKYDGDWQTYIGALQAYQKKLKAIQAKGTSATVTYKKRNVRLQGKSLATFLKHVDKRIAVTQCLADAEDASGLADFSTAAGSPETLSATLEPRKCGEIPNIKWWKFKSHDSITGYVNRKYNGDWVPYIDKWSTRLEKLVDIYNRDSSAVTNTGLILQGRDLFAYMEKMEQRISVINCLARNNRSSKV